MEYFETDNMHIKELEQAVDELCQPKTGAEIKKFFRLYFD